MQQLEHLVRGKRVVFVTTKNIDYIRNVQEIRFLERHAGKLKLVYSDQKNYALRVLMVWWKLLVLGRDYDVVFFGFAPQLVAPFFVKYRGRIIIIDFFISVYDTLVNDRKKIAAKNPLARLCHWVDTYVIQKADVVVTDTEADAAYFIRTFHGVPEKFKTIYLEADRSIYYPQEQCRKPALVGKFVVLYFGSVLPLQGVDIVLEAIELLKDRKDIFFQVIGPISGKYNAPVQDNVEYIDWLRQQELAAYIANADLCLAGHFNDHIDKAKRTIPGKAYIYSAMGKPMILGDNRANRELFYGSENVYWTKMGSARALAEKIVALRKSTDF